MDFKPYTPADLNWFHDLGPAWMIAAGILLLIVVGGFFLSIKWDDPGLGAVMTVVLTCGMFIPVLIASTTAMLIEEANSDNLCNPIQRGIEE